MRTLNSSAPRVLVIGAGVAGLATAYMLRARGRERGQSIKLRIVEAKERTGGATHTENSAGYVCEWGPNGFLDNEPTMLDLVARLNLTAQLVKASDSAAERFIYHHGKLRRVPLSPAEFASSNLLPVTAKLRVMLEYFIRAQSNGHDETVYEFARRRLGDRFARLVIDPMVSGIFAGNARELSLRAVFPKMVEMESQYGGLFRAMIAKRKANGSAGNGGGPAGSSAKLTTFKQGMGQLTAALAGELTDCIATNCAASGVSAHDSNFVVSAGGDSEQWDAVILACPSHISAELIRAFSPQTAAALAHIPFAPVDVVCHGYATESVDHPLHGFGVLIPRGEGKRMLGSLWCDSIFPGQAPRGHHLIRSILGGAHDAAIRDLNLDQLETTVQAENAALLGVHGTPDFRRVIRHERGIAQYTVGHLARVAVADKLESELPGLFFTGASYRGVSVNGCIKDAFALAERFWKGWMN